ncbi:MAG: hypothetical protein KJ069_14795 [Anaerolineae bacterium]|nr:hypothetical protein [Anaerolineae bacterium]
MKRLLDFAIRMVVVVALCLGVLGTARTGFGFAVATSYSSPQTTFFVSNTNDNGSGSLRQAILDANTTPGEDVIHINTIGTVNLLSALPTITEAVTIFVEDAHVLRIFIVNAQNSYRGLTITSVPVTISGLIVQNGAAFGTASGGGIRSEGNLTLNAVHVLNSSAYLGGGVSSDGSVVVNGGRYEGNIASNAGGGAIYAEGTVTVNGSIIQNNHCTDLGCYGGGLYVGSTLTMTNTEIISNTAAGDGGGVSTDGALVVTGTIFISNTAESRGGGAYISGSGPVQVTNSRFENNSSPNGNGGGLSASSADVTLSNVDFVGNDALGRGGLFALSVSINGGRFEQNTASGNSSGGLSADTVVLTDTHFISNTALNGFAGGVLAANIVAMGGSFEYNNPGGLEATGAMILTGTQFLNNSGGPAVSGTYSTQATDVLFANNSDIALVSDETTISNSQFVNNGQAILALGPLTVTNSLFMNNTPFGAIEAYNHVTISSTLFLRNSASLGGGLVQYDAGDVSIVNTLFAGNTVSGGGAAIHLEGEGTATLKHVTIASSEFATTTAITTSKDIVLIQNTIVANHDIGLNVTTGFVALNHALFHDNGLDVQGSIAADEGRVTGDPLFVNPGADNFHLQVGSVAIDAGLDADITTDFEGDVRPSGNSFDIGYDEFVPIQVPPIQIMLPIILR